MRILIYCRRKKDSDTLQKVCRHCAVMTEREECFFKIYEDVNLVKEADGFWDMLLFEIACKKDLEGLKELRSRADDARLLILAGKEVSPEQYVEPSVRPDMLLQRPYDRSKVFKVISRLFSFCYVDRERELLRPLVVRSGSEKRYFRYEQILYMEARDKKLLLCSRQGFTEFYGCLQEMEHILPEYFIRCHRSYIVNAMYVSRLNLSQSVIHISEKYIVPVSKKYKSFVNNRLKHIVKGEQQVLRKQEESLFILPQNGSGEL